MEYRDYYATLGVEKGASKADIKKAFRRLARENHPDVNKGNAAAEKRFKEISEANEVLSDPKKRKAYDQLGANWKAYQQAGAAEGNPFAGFSGGGASGGASGFPGGVRFEYRGNAEDLSGFSDFFRTFFTGGGEGAREWCGTEGCWSACRHRPALWRARRRHGRRLCLVGLRNGLSAWSPADPSTSGGCRRRRHHQPRGGHAWQ